ncbi:VCBS repeat-containing protein [Streptomyces sp. ITFR-16]|uniref:FG-GAP repeat domain-containing protein n=1 Tax=Streptomyces sp. ITFR-16 TaxID=3075198 RepID=UPI00288C0AE4|nr:VCBS repeat-containing protein [Streptomyces sp. ITFR-16]WNI23452.1 VCBS repeat-containing protein [Streptomyces sp. ITFR-16]
MTTSVRGRAALAVAVAGATLFAAAGAVPATAAGPAPAAVATTGVHGLDFQGGRLVTVERSASGDQMVYERGVSADGTTAGARESLAFAGTYANGAHLRTVPCDNGGCVGLVASGRGDVGVVFVDGDDAGTESVQFRAPGNSYRGTGVHYPAGTAKIVDLTGRAYAVEGGSPARQQAGVYPGYTSTADPIVRTPTAASVWGTSLWAAASATGALTATGLETSKVVEKAATGAPCVIKEVRAVGRWVYWNCGTTGAAGVYDRTAKKSFTVPSGPALVGDGYLVRHDRTAGKLLLTDFHTGTAAAPRAVADLPAGKTADQRRLTWAVDKFGGDIAYVDAAQTLHIVPSGVPAQPLAKLASDVGGDSVDIKGVNGLSAWLSTWQFSKPVTWTYTVKDPTGRTVRTLKGDSGTEADVAWDGRTDAGGYSLNGRHTWSLKATAEDGAGTYTTSGAVYLGGGRAGFHDQGGLSTGDLVTLNSSGGLTVQFGQDPGTFSGKKSGSGWPAGTLAVPFTDTGSDRCSELLVRMPGGELRQYAGRCGTSGYTPGGKHTVIGGGWQQYDVLTSPGDLNGDGRSDLVARQTSTGDMYFYAGAPGGKFAVKTRINTDWRTYAQIAGVGDITGDGIPDLLGHDRNGGLWRYDGLGNGRFAPRVKVFSDWGSTYNAMVGVGDLSGDGRNDIVLRDPAGNLFRNNGNGKGSFGARTRIATGWQTYKGIF